MPATRTRLETAMARRYLVALCKHFKHKVPATWSEDYSAGAVDFGFASCTMRADDAVLEIEGGAPDEAGTTRMEKVIDLHLERFAFREKPTLAWVRG